MQALTLWPEWIPAITRLGKDIENRPWEPPQSLLGKRFALHAGSTIGGKPGKDSIYQGIAAVVHMARRAGWNGSYHYGPDGVTFQRGEEEVTVNVADIRLSAVVATCRLAGFGVGLEAKDPWAASLMVNWKIDEVIVLPEPVPCRGYQKLWGLTADVEGKVLAGEHVIRRQLADAACADPNYPWAQRGGRTP